VIFSYSSYKKTTGIFLFNKSVEATANDCLNNGEIKSFFHEFSMRMSSISFEKNTEEYVLVIGKRSNFDINGYAYGVCATTEGVTVIGNSRQGLVDGFMTLLDLILPSEQGAYIECCELLHTPSVKNRMVHICVFPETTLDFLRKTLRFCVFCKYTHAIIEFWGMYRFECLKELSWENSYTREELLPILRDAEALGLELIPMFNHLGHAAQARMFWGKHVTLDQNPSLWYLFEDDGWAWNIEKAQQLLASVRRELCDFFPRSRYFHIGCDEAHSFSNSIDKAKAMVKHINKVSDDLKALGKETIIWGDMLQKKNTFNGDGNTYEFNIESDEIATEIRENISRDIIIADWQYAAKKSPVASAVYLKDNGRKTMVCPFLDVDNLLACADTAIKHSLDGVIYTTWHELNKKMWMLLHGGIVLNQGYNDMSYVRITALSASVLRKTCPSNGDYRMAGWIEKQI